MLPAGQTYTAKFYGWRSDGGASDVTEFEFYHGCRGMCGDANGDGSVNVNDAVYLINLVQQGGPPPQPIWACGNANGDSSVNISDAVYVINYVFVTGAQPPGDCNPAAFPEACCPFEE